ncbi:MAG: ABC transporter ATP-binding protein [Acidimicrobiales bacterium]
MTDRPVPPPAPAVSGLRAQLGVDRGEFSLDLPLSIEAGTTLALLGPNGAGKSTTVSALAGLRALDRGFIELAGRTLDRAEGPGHLHQFVPSEHRRIGVVFQHYALFPHLSVIDNVAFGLRHGVADGRVNRQHARAIAAGWLETLGIADVGDARPAAISGGQAQRAALARALAIEPDLLLLDEPLSALDVSTRAGLRRTLRQVLADFEGPCLLITHDPTDAFMLADQVCILERGRIVQTGTPEEIRAHPATSYVADLAGLNLLEGTSDGERLTTDAGAQLQSATSLHGPVLIAIRPAAVSLHRSAPSGSPRNAWSTTITGVEPLGEIVRVQLGGPVPLMVDITPAAAHELELGIGSTIWAAVKATEITVTPN